MRFDVSQQATLRRAVGGTSIVDLRAVIRRKDAEIARLNSALAAAERETAEWRRKWQLAYSGDACPAFDVILKAVCEEFGVSKTCLLGDGRDLSLPRHVAMYLCREKTRRNPTMIGKFFRRDRTTVVVDCRRLAAKLEKDADLAARVKRLSEQLDKVA